MIIGLTGYKRSGKSTAAKYLAEKYGFVRHNFKDALVEELKENFPDLLQAITDQWNLQSWGGPEKTIDQMLENKHSFVRELMQNYGTEVRRKDDPNYWTDKWHDNLPKGNVVVDDVRFKNESYEVHSISDGYIIRIERTDISSGGDHSSETEQDMIVPDYTITCEPNEHDHLYQKLDEIIAELGLVSRD